MEEDQKFYLTPTRMIDADIIGDVQYFPVGSPTGMNILTDDGTKPELRKQAELHIEFKNPEKGSITLCGEDADRAWKNYRKVAGPTTDRLVLYMQEREAMKSGEKPQS